MRAVFAGFIAVLGSAYAAPVMAQATNLEVVREYTDLVRKKGAHQASGLLTQKIIWENQNNPQGREASATSYTLYLALSDTMIGVAKSVSCKEVDAVEVSCTFSRVSDFGFEPQDIIERYFVEGGKIVKVANIIPPEILSLAPAEKKSEK